MLIDRRTSYFICLYSKAFPSYNILLWWSPFKSAFLKKNTWSIFHSYLEATIILKHTIGVSKTYDRCQRVRTSHISHEFVLHISNKELTISSPMSLRHYTLSVEGLTPSKSWHYCKHSASRKSYGSHFKLADRAQRTLYAGFSTINDNIMQASAEVICSMSHTRDRKGFTPFLSSIESMSTQKTKSTCRTESGREQR